MKQKKEQRGWPRHRANFPVSLKYSDTSKFSRTWHAGETHDVSVDGMRIVASSLKEIKLSSRLEILCFPSQTSLLPCILEAEPVTMTGIVMWQDLENKSIGVKLCD